MPYFLILLVGWCGRLTAQAPAVDTTFYPPGDDTSAFPAYPRAILSPYTETGRIEVFATVEYAGHTRVYVRTSDVASAAYRLEMPGQTHSLTQRTDGKWELDISLPANTAVKLVAQPTGQAATDLLGFNTRHGRRQVFEASDELLAWLSDWKTQAPTTPLLTYLLSAADIHPVEKYDYIQHHFYRDELLPNAFLTAFPTEQDIDPDLPCTCSFVVRVGHDIVPHGGITINGEIIPNYGTSGKINGGNWEYWHDWSFEGLPRFYQQISQGNGTHAVHNHDAGISFFRNEILYNCSNSPNSLPEGCDCEVPVRYDLMYTSELFAYADARSCMMCGNRDAETKVNDIVLAYFGDEVGNNDTLGMNAGSAWAIEERDDPAIVKLILPVASIALNLAAIKGTAGLKLALSGAKIAADLAKIASILNDPSSKAKHKSDSKFMTMMGSGQKNILPNVRSEFIVISLTLHAFDNRRRFFTQNRVLSSGYLQTWIEGGPLDVPGANPKCCVPHVTQYAHAAFTSRLTPQNMINNMSNNYSTVMPPISNQIGHLTAAFPGCDVPVEGRQAVPEVNAYANEDFILLDSAPTQPFHFAVFDLAGRCLYQGKQTDPAIDLQGLNLGAGAYLFRAQSGELNTTLRFVRF